MVLDNTDIAGPTSTAGSVVISDVKVVINNGVTDTDITDVYKSAASESIDAYSAYNESLLVDTITIKDYAELNEEEASVTLNTDVETYLKNAVFDVNMTGTNYEGSRLNENITGTDAADTISGGAGNDTITAGKGADVIYGGTGDNEFVFNAADGEDNIMDAKLGDVIRIEVEGKPDADNSRPA